MADAGIDIDYNTATGSLSAATNAAIDSLSGKGWEVFINGVLVIPNILDLAPAAASVSGRSTLVPTRMWLMFDAVQTVRYETSRHLR